MYKHGNMATAGNDSNSDENLSIYKPYHFTSDTNLERTKEGLGNFDEEIDFGLEHVNLARSNLLEKTDQTETAASVRMSR